MNPFLEACGAISSLQLSIECPGAPRAESVTFDLPFVLIGRDPGADLRFPHQDVSARHVYLQMVAGHLCYMDLGSRMGTFLGGKCPRSGWLPRRESIRVGPYRVRLLGGDSGERVETNRLAGALHEFAPSPPPDASPAPPTLALELNHRGIRPALCPIRGDLTLIGSAADCDVRVLDPSVANFHCSLLHTTTGVWVVDLLGPGGVTVNGAAVRHARLDDGDALRIGHSLIRLRVGTSRAVTACTCAFPTAIEPAGSPALDQGALIEAILTPLSEQFDLMRQQMFEQLQQVGVVLCEQFAATQEEQVRALRDEMEQFRRAAHELDALRSDLATQSGPPSSAASPIRLGLATVASSCPVRAHSAIALARPEAHSNGNGNGHAHGNGKPRADQEQATPGPLPAAAKAADSSATDPERQQDVDIHAWLRERMALIQNEQQSRWQKILRMIPGQLLGKPTV